MQRTSGPPSFVSGRKSWTKERRAEGRLDRPIGDDPGEARGAPFRLVNAGVSGDTTSGGLARVDWLLKQAPRVVVVELGCNDGLRGLDLEQIEANLRGILERVRASGAEALLLEMHIPTSYGRAYEEGFSSLYGELAEELGVASVPRFLEGVGGQVELNLPDGIHPNARGHELLAEKLVAPLETLLEN